MSRLAVRALCIAISGLVLSWLLLADKSPLSTWLAGQPHVTNVVSAINLPTVLFALAGVPGMRPPSDAGVALVAVFQWLVYGVIAAWLWRKL